MIIHFICTGNICRSWIAEAYCKSKGVSGLDVMSSGIQTILNGGLPIASYAADVLGAYGLERFAAASWKQTTPALVRASDVLVFMEREHYHFCKDWVDSGRQRFEIWDISDVDSEVGATEIMIKVERTFATIKRQTDSRQNSRDRRTGNPPSMLDKITTALIAVVFASLVTWYVLSPFHVPLRYLRAHSSAESSTGTAPLLS
jgi:protein-tyrosine-phosphatase